MTHSSKYSGGVLILPIPIHLAGLNVIGPNPNYIYLYSIYILFTFYLHSIYKPLILIEKDAET